MVKIDASKKGRSAPPMGCRLLGVTFIDVWKILRAFQDGILPYMVFIGFLSFSIPNPIGLARFAPKDSKRVRFLHFLTVFIKMMKIYQMPSPRGLNSPKRLIFD